MAQQALYVSSVGFRDQRAELRRICCRSSVRAEVCALKMFRVSSFTVFFFFFFVVVLCFLFLKSAGSVVIVPVSSFCSFSVSG